MNVAPLTAQAVTAANTIDKKRFPESFSRKTLFHCVKTQRVSKIFTPRVFIQRNSSAVGAVSSAAQSSR